MSESLYQNMKTGFPKVHNVDHLMQSMKGGHEMLGEGAGWKEIELPMMGSSETQHRYFVNNLSVAVDLLAVKAMKGGSASTATATLSNMDAEGGAANPLSGANIDLHALTNDAKPVAQTLSSTAAAIRVPPGGRVKVTLATGGSGSLAGGLLQFFFQPIS